MSSSEHLVRILSVYSRRAETPHIAAAALFSFAKKYAARYVDQQPELEDLITHTDETVTAHLHSLSEQGRCSLSFDGNVIGKVYYSGYYFDAVASEYRKLEQRPELPLPNEDVIHITPPAELIQIVDMGTDFVMWLEQSASVEEDQLLRLIFPHQLPSCIITSHIMQRSLPDLTLQRIRSYLRSERNAGYMRSKLQAVFPHRDASVRDMITAALTTPAQVLSGILEPTDFTFHFWSQFAGIIIKDYSNKKDRLAEEDAFTQAAFILSYLTVFYKGRAQKTQEHDSAIRRLEQSLRASPYAHTISDVMGFTDSRGVPLSKNLSRDVITKHLASLLRGESGALGALVRVNTTKDQQYYLARENLIRVAVDGVFTAGLELRKHYIDQWSNFMREDKKVKAMVSDEAFAKSVNAVMAENFPLILALLDEGLLLACSEHTQFNAAMQEQYNALFLPKTGKLKSTEEILSLNREELYNDARLVLPFWMVTPGLNSVVRFLRRLFLAEPRNRSPRGSSARTEESSDELATANGISNRTTKKMVVDDTDDSQPARSDKANSGSRSKAQSLEFQKAIKQLEREFLGTNRKLDETLQELADRWNPLLDERAKRNLIEDVNSLTRDFLRRMKVGFRMIPPDANRIRDLARRLSQNDAFSEIRRKKDLERYLELYMLKLLGKIK
ncbi:MAG: hypothetical protein EA428_07575 [Spirochaetaceae bacterium]|nr:MAG: hypothetical protein EA428_07575 [Spirochaetaceae bacterium]